MFLYLFNVTSWNSDIVKALKYIMVLKRAGTISETKDFEITSFKIYKYIL